MFDLFSGVPAHLRFRFRGCLNPALRLILRSALFLYGSRHPPRSPHDKPARYCMEIRISGSPSPLSLPLGRSLPTDRRQAGEKSRYFSIPPGPKHEARGRKLTLILFVMLCYVVFRAVDIRERQQRGPDFHRLLRMINRTSKGCRLAFEAVLCLRQRRDVRYLLVWLQLITLWRAGFPSLKAISRSMRPRTCSRRRALLDTESCASTRNEIDIGNTRPSRPITIATTISGTIDPHPGCQYNTRHRDGQF